MASVELRTLLIWISTSVDWRLISLAATASSVAYNNKNHVEGTLISGIKRGRKFMTMSLEGEEHSRVLVVSIRGTMTPADWMLNFNNAPKYAPRVSTIFLV